MPFSSTERTSTPRYVRWASTSTTASTTVPKTAQALHRRPESRRRVVWQWHRSNGDSPQPKRTGRLDRTGPYGFESARNNHKVLTVTPPNPQQQLHARREFLSQTKVGIGSLALWSLLNSTSNQQTRAAGIGAEKWTGILNPSALYTALSPGHSPLHGRRSFASGNARLQTQAQRTRRATDARIADQEANPSPNFKASNSSALARVSTSKKSANRDRPFARNSPISVAWLTTCVLSIRSEPSRSITIPRTRL